MEAELALRSFDLLLMHADVPERSHAELYACFGGEEFVQVLARRDHSIGRTREDNLLKQPCLE